MSMYKIENLSIPSRVPIPTFILLSTIILCSNLVARGRVGGSGSSSLLSRS